MTSTTAPRERVAALVARLGRWSTGRGPLYLLLAARFRQLIDEGVLRPGTALPPDRALASALAVGRTTVVAAYEALRQEGRIVRRQGSGTRVADVALAPPDERLAAGDATSNPLFLHLLEPPDGVILLSCASPEGAPPEVARAYAGITFPAADLGYHPAGHPALRAALADRFTARGLPTGPERILVTTGAQQALSLLTRHLVAPGDPVLVEAPTYPGALDLFREAAGVPLPVPTGPEGVDVAVAVRMMAAHRPAFAYVISRFQNPTGGVLPPLPARRLAAAAREHGVPLVDDEVLAELPLHHEEFTGPPPLAAQDGAGDVLTIGSLSKVVWGGLRIGWLRGPAPLVARLARLKAVHDLGTDVPAQLAAVELIAGLDALRARRVRELRARHDHLRAELTRNLPSWHCPPVRGGQTLWARLPQGDAVAFAQVALRHGVAVLPGAVVDPTGASTRCLRLHFLSSPAELTEAVRRLATAWRSYSAEPYSVESPHGLDRAGRTPEAVDARR
ncbi:PLP-dependent aminotransferase family protein [Streptomyces sp. NPDC048172]|uniref:aminotransferase-like domain-containing protein n=1 Tax=Streptomyces sp. NPDC048172 TaxID=3365505 RepID=UPI0037167885